MLLRWHLGERFAGRNHIWSYSVGDASTEYVMEVLLPLRKAALMSQTQTRAENYPHTVVIVSWDFALPCSAIMLVYRRGVTSRNH